jgi:hypothetical protein
MGDGRDGVYGVNGVYGVDGEKGEEGTPNQKYRPRIKKSGAKWCKVGELFVTLEPKSNKEV